MLNTLSFANCPMFRGLQVVGQPLLQLRSLTIKDSPVTDADIATATMACPKLDYFCLQVCCAWPTAVASTLSVGSWHG